jgi:carbonic anhydrase/acetyltransferase-like protein (isoleucine patch superfamily)
MERSRRRRGFNFRPFVDQVEGRLVLSHGGPHAFLQSPPGFQAVRPNTPVLPFGAPLSTATFIDPSVGIINGNHTVVGQKTFVGPYAVLDSTVGFIKIGTGSDVLDNATIASTALGGGPVVPSNVLVGDSVSIGYGATLIGPSTIGAYGTPATKPTAVGANSLINAATIEPGAVVGPLARVGPGVTVPAGIYVKPGANVTTEAEASDPALGKVEPLPASVLTDVMTLLSRSIALASGYSLLFDGNSATGANAGLDASISGLFNGTLAAVSGTSPEPGPTSSTAATGITFEPSRTGPKFPGIHKAQTEADIPQFPARITGDARFMARVHVVAHNLGARNAIRADQGQPITFAGAPITGRAVTINSPGGGTVTTGGVTKTVGGITIGTNFQAGPGVVLLGGPDPSYKIGDNVTIGGGSVVSRTSIGTGAVIGVRSYIARSTIAPGTIINPGTIEINNVIVGTVEW